MLQGTGTRPRAVRQVRAPCTSAPGAAALLGPAEVEVPVLRLLLRLLLRLTWMYSFVACTAPKNSSLVMLLVATRGRWLKLRLTCRGEGGRTGSESP